MTYEIQMRDRLWFKGYMVIVSEKMERYAYWELYPMSDAYGVPDVYIPSGKWEIRAHKTYATDRNVETCRETLASAMNIGKGAANELLKVLKSRNVPAREVKDLFETATLEAEALRYMP